MITNFNLFNLKVPDVFNNFIAKLFSSAIMRRKIPLQKISALTVSKQGYEFVIHVPDEYDYRYCSVERYTNFSKFYVNFFHIFWHPLFPYFSSPTFSIFFVPYFLSTTLLAETLFWKCYWMHIWRKQRKHFCLFSIKLNFFWFLPFLK